MLDSCHAGFRACTRSTMLSLRGNYKKTKQARNDNSAWQAGDFRAKTTSHTIPRGSACTYPAISLAMESGIEKGANGKNRVESVPQRRKQKKPRGPRLRVQRIFSDVVDSCSLRIIYVRANPFCHLIDVSQTLGQFNHRMVFFLIRCDQILAV